MSSGSDAIDALFSLLAAGRASDLVLEPRDDGSLDAVARVEGVRRSITTISNEHATAAIARLKALARLPAYITTEPQDGRIDGRSFGIPGDIRLAVFPTVRGQRIAMRLPAIGALPDPESLGFEPRVVTHLRRLMREPDGIVLITGPTGSGKTTTIHSLLRELASERPDRQILTLEDPVERLIPGIAQAEIKAHTGFGFQEALRSALRQDADVLVVGEVRDVETATTAVRASLSGHLVVATLHAGRASEVVPRLLDMGVDRDLLIPALRAILSQRLLRLAHRGCHGAGCGDCHGGYLGRRVVTDLALVDHPARQRLRDGHDLDLTADMDRQAAELVDSQATDRGEVLRVLGRAG
ncbi:MAG: Flp pilus assembly complex ATPase component TadA [Planctomycetes bacterium]|nr:Flp pilus assembly complex ATPase component TadA [Planctomycetota bacterium]